MCPGTASLYPENHPRTTTRCKQSPEPKKKVGWFLFFVFLSPDNKTLNTPSGLEKYQYISSGKGEKHSGCETAAGFGSQPEQELKSKTIFFCSGSRLWRQNREGSRAGRGAGGGGQRAAGRGGRNVFFISQCIIYKQH